MIIDQFYTFFEAERLVNLFEKVLNNSGIKIASGSELERLCLNATDLVEKHLNPQLRDEDIDIRPFFRECLGLNDLIAKILKSSTQPNFSSLLPYLRKINDNNPIQNTRTSVLNQFNNKLFELFVATLCLNLEGSSLSIDDPDHSVGDNPDILVEIEGKIWGLACKTIHSNSPMTIFENIEKAVSQLEKSIAEVGIPVINIKNIIDHDSYWPEIIEEGSNDKYFGAFTSMEIPLANLKGFCGQIQKDIVTHVGGDNVRKIFQAKKSFPAALLYSSTVTSISIGNKPHATRFNFFNIIAFGDIDPYCIKVCEKLNHELQVVENI